jgi:aryl-alcohol dehydrogenase-like predicted oxidoreductase
LYQINSATLESEVVDNTTSLGVGILEEAVTSKLALAFILAQPFQPRVLSGAATPAQLESNWEAE